MKRKNMILILAILFVVMSSTFTIYQFNQKRVSLEKNSTIVGTFKYKEDNINAEFSSEDTAIIYEIFNKKRFIKMMDYRVDFRKTFL